MKIRDEKVEPIEPRQPACRPRTRSALFAGVAQTHGKAITSRDWRRYRGRERYPVPGATPALAGYSQTASSTHGYLFVAPVVGCFDFVFLLVGERQLDHSFGASGYGWCLDGENAQDAWTVISAIFRDRLCTRRAPLPCSSSAPPTSTGGSSTASRDARVVLLLLKEPISSRRVTAARCAGR